MTEYNIRLNPNCASVVHTGLKFKSGDKGIKFVIAVDELDTTGTTAKIVFQRANGTSVESDITGTDGVYNYKTLGNEFAVPGKTVADVKFYASEERVSTASFVFEVWGDTLDGLGVGTGGYSDQLEKLVSDAERMAAEMKKSLQEFKEQFGEEGALTPRGEWTADVTYELRDIVYHSECMWIALTENVGTEPSKENASVWMPGATGGGASSEEIQNIINGTTPVAKSKDAETLGGKTPSDFAPSADHNIKTYTSLTQLGLSIDDFSEADFLATAKTIVTAMPNGSIMIIQTSKGDNLAKSVVSKINNDCGTSYSVANAYAHIYIQKNYTINGMTEIKAYLDISGGRTKIYTCIFDTTSSTSTVSKFAESYNANGFLSLDDSASMSGPFRFKNGYGRLNAADNWVSLQSWETNDGNLQNGRAIQVNNSKHKSYSDIKDALQIRDVIDGTETAYTAFHTGNKPTGSYTGNGSATARTINAGGIGDVCMLRSGASYMGYITAVGGVMFEPASGAIKYYTAAQIKFVSGVLTIASDEILVNKSGSTYYYQVL